MKKTKKGFKEHLATKVCQQCGITFQYRKSLKKDWAMVKFCSKSCRSKYKKAKSKRLNNL
ncbi:MAG: DUF2256 domain-containing protein [Patescibacteria group bacterium]